MKKHTTLNLDTRLLKDASAVLGTSQATETIHVALQEVINLEKRKRLAARDFDDLTPELLDDIRKPRFSKPTDPFRD